MKPAPNMFLPVHSKEKIGKETPPYALIMDNLETYLDNTVDKARGSSIGSIVERFIKPRSSTIFCHPLHSLDGTGQSITVSGPHE